MEILLTHATLLLTENKSIFVYIFQHFPSHARLSAQRLALKFNTKPK